MLQTHLKAGPMPIANLDEVQSVLKEFEGRIRDVVERAWEDWRSLPSGRFMYARTRSNIVFDLICQHAAVEFDEDPAIYVIEKAGTLQFLFADRVLVRFKKGNSKGVGSNIVTQAVLDFVDPQLTIPGLPEVHRVEACYQTDVLGTRLEELAIVARNRSRRIWAYPISGGEPAADVFALPVRPSDPTPPPVTPKRRSDEADAAE